MLRKYWNGKPLGLMAAFVVFVGATSDRLRDEFSTFIWRFNFRKIGKGSRIQHSTMFRYPQNFVIGDNVNIGRSVEIFSELSNSTFTIGNNSQLNRNVSIDYTGDIKIEENVVISANVKILTHSHGYDPKSKPIKKPLTIQDNVWIGEGVLILENVDIIGKDSIIAAGAVVTKSVEENIIVGGNPARFIKEKAKG